MSPSSGFLMKSIILLGLLLLSLGASLFLGKELGRNIMDLTRSHIQEKVGEVAAAGVKEDNYMLDVVGTRSDFGYNPDEFGANQFNRGWADPHEDNFSTVSDEPEVAITLLPENTGEEGSATETGTDGTEKSTGEEKPATEKNNETIFEFGSPVTYRIQVGSFSDRTNAESIWRRLTQAGFDASVSVENDGDNVQYRVIVGVYTSREQADKDAERLRAMNFDAWVYQLK
ncbi:MAG: SPOR domain-containing protein [bacterium]